MDVDRGVLEGRGWRWVGQAARVIPEVCGE